MMGDESEKDNGESGGRRVARELPTGGSGPYLTLATNHLDGFRTDPTDDPEAQAAAKYLPELNATFSMVRTHSQDNYQSLPSPPENFY
jgi:hypothetical protein